MKTTSAAFLVILSVVAISSTILSTILPLAAGLTTPGFPSSVLLQDYRYLVLSSLSLLVLGVIWFRFGDNQIASLIVTICFSILFLDVWVAKAPGKFFGDVPITQYGLWTTSHFNSNLPWGALTGIFTLVTSLGSLTGMTFVQSMEVSAFIEPILYAFFSYMVAKNFLGPSRSIVLATAFSLVADLELSKVPPTGIGADGILFFLLLVYVLTSIFMRNDSAGLVIYFLLFFGSILVYPLASIVVLLIMISKFMATHILSHKSPLVLRTRRRTQGILALSFVILASWIAFNISNLVNGIAISAYSVFFSLFSSNSGGTVGGGSGHFFSLIQLLGSNISASPGVTGYLFIMWFLLLYGLGSLIYLLMLIARHGHNMVPAYLMIPLGVVAAYLVLEPGGIEFPRILPYAGILLAVSVVGLINGRRKTPCLVFMALILLLTIPTIVAYYPDIGVFGSWFPSDLAAGAYIGHSLTPSQNYYSPRQVVFNLTFAGQWFDFLPSGASTPRSADDSFTSAVKQFELGRGSSVFLISPLSWLIYQHLYGNVSASLVRETSTSLVNSQNVIYSNGFDFVLE